MIEDIAAYLVTGTIGTIGTDIFLAYVPEDPDTCVMLFEYAGSAPDMTHDKASDENPGLQVRVRSQRGEYQTGHDLAKSVQTLLHGVSNTTINSVSYKLIKANHSIAFMGFDDRERPEFVQNFSVMKAM